MLPKEQIHIFEGNLLPLLMKYSGTFNWINKTSSADIPLYSRRKETEGKGFTLKDNSEI